ncbi:MAG: class I SAM-dependent methyltransferase [Dehalococcoidia bacterium]|nr:class I SAM-dependent methyltransferase [Dehalococcoidia bacterium]MDH4366691.1 class I SAM-dependent methyltransferase [Dehalococcoidia bacterium]
MSREKRGAGNECRQKDQKKLKWSDWLFLRRPPAFLDPIRRLFEPPKKLVGPYVKDGQVVADLGCGSGYYTLALAELVGPKGKVYAVDLGKSCIRALEKKARKGGYRNIEAHASSASDVSFIKDKSVDFVLANGLLCSMAEHRKEVVNEIKRILKRKGQAYLSLGASPPFGYVDQAEWDNILEEFKIEQGGSYKDKWALVSVKRE